MDRDHFQKSYLGPAPWDIPGPQPAFVGLEEAGAIHESVLDAGCGTGENALYLASRGHEVWGIDFVPVAIERAREKAKQRGLTAHFPGRRRPGSGCTRTDLRRGDRLRVVPHLQR